LEGLFPKARQQRISEQLNVDERRDFNLTMQGKRRPMEGELERWGRLAGDQEGS
jgi:uncharacterized protein YqgV (UPF0045/DUF77 family)